jgi:hypothetical protein
MKDKFLYTQRREPRPEAVEALWRTLQEQEGIEMNYQKSTTPARRWIWALATIVILLIASLSLAPVRAAALELFAFFAPAESDTRSVEALVPAADGEPAGITGTLDDVSAAAGFDLLLPDALPDGYALEEARFDPETGTTELLYRYSPMQGFVLTQQPVERFEAAGAPPVGPEAEIQTVSIGEARGQYVQGMWIATDDPGDTPPGEVYNGELVWQPVPMVRTLAWEQDGFVLVLTAQGDPEDDTGGILLREELVEVARSLE